MDVWFWVWLLTIVEFTVYSAIKNSKCKKDEKIGLLLIGALLVGDAWSIIFLSDFLSVTKHFLPTNIMNMYTLGIILMAIFLGYTITTVFVLWMDELLDCWAKSD